jgi:hypothetical protein
MNRKNCRGLAYLSCLATLMMACFATAAYSQQTSRKAASSPKYSRDWMAVVQKMLKMTVFLNNDNRIMEIGKRAGLEITTYRAGDRQTIWFDDPVTHETVLRVSIIEETVHRDQAH